MRAAPASAPHRDDEPLHLAVELTGRKRSLHHPLTPAGQLHTAHPVLQDLVRAGKGNRFVFAEPLQVVVLDTVGVQEGQREERASLNEFPGVPVVGADAVQQPLTQSLLGVGVAGFDGVDRAIDDSAFVVHGVKRELRVWSTSVCRFAVALERRHQRALVDSAP